MKRTRVVVIGLMVCVALLTGCEQLKKFMAPRHRRPRPTVSAVPDLEIIGVTEEEQIALRDLLVVKGLLQQAADYVVMINTQLVRKGESLQMGVREDVYDVKVVSVSEMRVVLEAKKIRSGARAVRR